MNRRRFLATLMAAPLARPALAAEAGWQARLIAGGFDGTSYLAGLHVMLAPGWKTYWRVPGEAGIPPQIKAEGRNLASLRVDAPLPLRISDGSGEAIGYHDEVVFLLRLTPKLVKDPLEAAISAFFGVCEQICKPARFSGLLALKPGAAADAPALATWQARLPQPQDFISRATQQGDRLQLSLRHQVDDIFIEGPETLYFRAPAFSGTQASIKIDGLEQGQSLTGIRLRCTAAMQGKGLEQAITVT